MKLKLLFVSCCLAAGAISGHLHNLSRPYVVIGEDAPAQTQEKPASSENDAIVPGL